MNKLEEVKKLLIEIVLESGEKFDGGSWYADYSYDWDEEYDCLITDLFAHLLSAIQAKNSGDRLALLVSLMMIRIEFMNLYNFFYHFYEDFEKLIGEDSMNWPNIPEGYKYQGASSSD